MRLGTKLQQLRRARCLSVAQVARAALGYTRNFAGFARLENAVLRAIPLETLEALGRFFHEDLRLVIRTIDDGHYDASVPVEQGPGSELRVAQLKEVLRFGGQPRNQLQHFEDILSVERYQAWLDGSVAPDLPTMDGLSKYFDLTRAWLPAGT